MKHWQNLSNGFKFHKIVQFISYYVFGVVFNKMFLKTVMVHESCHSGGGGVNELAETIVFL